MTDIQVSKIDQKRPVFVRMQNGRKIKINQPNSNLFSLAYRPKKLSKSKLESSKTPRNPSPKRDPVDLDTTRRLVLVSKPHNLPSREFTSTRSAHSPPMSPSEEESSRVSSFPPRCQEPLFSEEITFITSRSITDSRRDITTYQLTALHVSEEPRPEMSSLLDNADLFPRLLDSTSLELRRRESKVTLERLSSCSEQSGSSYKPYERVYEQIKSTSTLK